MNLRLLLCLLFCASLSAMAQVNTDSLLRVWNDASQHDTARLSAIQQTTWEVFQHTAPDSALYYTQLQGDFAAQSGHVRWKALALKTQGMVCSNMGQSEKALASFQESIAIAESVKDDRIKFASMANMGRLYWMQGNYNEALKQLKASLAYQKQVDDKENTGKLNGFVGQVYYSQGNYTQAIAYLNTGLQQLEALGNENATVDTRNSLAAIYTRQKSYARALELFEHNLAIGMKTGNPQFIAQANSNIGTTYSEQGQYKKAIEYMQKALDIVEPMGIQRAIAGISGTIGGQHFALQEFDRALDYYQKALVISEASGALFETSLMLSGIAAVYAAQEQHQKALDFGQRSLAIGQQMGNLVSIEAVSKILAESHKALGNHRQALQMHELYIESRDSLASEKNQQAVLQQQYQYEYDKKALADSLDFAQKEALTAITIQKQEADLATQQISLIAALGGILLLLVLALFIYRAKKRSDGATRQIQEQKNEIEILLDAKEVALMRAEASEKSKELFLANMSHEIRTPLNAVIGFAEILRKEQHSARQGDFLETIQSSGENLLVIINDILDFSKIEAGKLEIEAIPFSLSKALNACDAMLRPNAEDKDLKFVVKHDTAIPPVLVGDPVRISQILVNLVNNAVKFTEAGQVSIVTRLVSENAKQATVELAVADTGIGIAKDNMDTIFETFTQAEADTSRRYGGTGLGTTIVKRLVEMQDGTIAVTSDLGIGSTFTATLTFPISDLDPANLATASTASAFEPVPLTGKLIVADDNKINQRLALEVLASFGLQADYADNGLEVLELLKANDYDLILMDLQMPEMDGLEATVHIRANMPKPKCNIPVVAMSAHSLTSHLQRCKDAGMQDHISKPFRQDTLYNSLVKYLPENNNKQAVAPVTSTKTRTRSKAANTASSALLDLSYLTQIARGNTAFIIEMLTSIRTDTTADLAAIADMLEEQNWNGIQARLHKSSSTLQMLGNKELSTLVKAIGRNCEDGVELEAVPSLVHDLNNRWAELAPEVNRALAQLAD